MPTTSTTSAILAAATVPPSGTKAAPAAAGVGGALNVSGHYGGEIYAKITNGATGPTAPGIISIYFSYDGNDWYELVPVYGDLAANSSQSAPIPLDIGVKYVRADAYGNTGQAVTASVYVTWITAP